MEVVSFKCPNCGGELVFDPNTQNYSCPYCNSEFSQEQIDTMQKGKQPSQESEAADSAKGQEQNVIIVRVRWYYRKEFPESICPRRSFPLR